MAIIREFRTIGDLVSAPYIRGVVNIPGLGAWGWLWFLVDSGADKTTLHPRDIESLGIDYQRLMPSNSYLSEGIGGHTAYYIEPAYLIFPDDRGVSLACLIDIDICHQDYGAHVANIPSLLGRDFLNLCDVRLNHAANIVALDPLSVDNGFILPP